MINNSKERLFEVMSHLDKTFKIKLNEEVVEASVEEKTDLDEKKPETEGSSYKAKLEEINKLAKKAYENLPDGDLPSWLQDKIVISKEHLKDINEYLHVKEEKEEDETEEKEHEENETPEEEHEEHESDEEEKEESEETSKKIPVVDIAKGNK